MSENAKWSAQHDEILLRAMIQYVLTGRRTLYATPGLEDVAHNGGDKINKNVIKNLRRLADGVLPGLPGSLVIAEEIKRITPVRGGGGGGGRTEKSDTAREKERKREVEEESKVVAKDPRKERGKKRACAKIESDDNDWMTTGSAAESPSTCAGTSASVGASGSAGAGASAGNKDGDNHGGNSNKKRLGRRHPRLDVSPARDLVDEEDFETYDFVPEERRRGVQVVYTVSDSD